MIRSLYTGASGMLAQLSNMDVIANNLANVDQTGFKKDKAIFKAFPDMLIRRLNDDGVRSMPNGSYDVAPVVGKLGTGVELNDVHTDFTQGNNLRQTNSPFDAALVGKGFYAVQTQGTQNNNGTPNDDGIRYTRNGTFTITNDGFLVTKEGFKVLDVDNKPIQIKLDNFKIQENGDIIENSNFNRYDLGQFVDAEKNEWNNTQKIATLKVVNFYDERELVKEGSSFYRATPQAGNPVILGENEGKAKILQGFIETSNVNPVTEMVDMIAVHRSYEANQKALKTADEILGKAVNEVGRT